jgi:twitching motility protein PilT
MSTDPAAIAERFIKKKKEYEIDKLFRALVKLLGSDLHLKVDRPPFVRIKGKLRALERGPIDDEEMTRLILPIMDERCRKILNDTGGADFAHQCEVD